MAMDIAFARQLIEHPGEATTRRLFQERHAGIFWVDWREADDDIVTMAAKALGRDDLRPIHDGGKFLIEFRGRRFEVPLQNKPGEQDITLESLNRALDPEFEVRYVKASEGGDTIAFMGLPTASWLELEASFGARVAPAFARLDRTAPLFAHEELPPGFMDALHKQMGPIHFQRVALRITTAERATALLADAARTGAATPVIDALSDDLAMTYFHDLIGGDHAEVTEGELQQYGVSVEEMRGQAFQNAEATWTNLRYEYRGEALYKMVSADGMVASTLVMADSLWENFAQQGLLLAAFPHRDIVLFARADQPDGVAALLEAVAHVDPRDPQSLSRHVHAWSPDGWRVHPLGDAARTFRQSDRWREAESGKFAAMCELALDYEFMRLHAEAVKWYYKGAVQAATVPRTSDDMYENGSACQRNLADKYEHGLGVPQDFTKAHYWYGKSAAMGNEVAQYSLGNLYLAGRGVAKDVAQARLWFEKSAARGYADAAEALKSLG